MLLILKLLTPDGIFENHSPCRHSRRCRTLSMFNCALRGHRWLPKYLSSDHDPLYRFHQWQANLRILEVTEIKSIPYVPLSHPFVERLVGTLRREYLDHMLFWTTAVWKTSCSISVATSTTIARIPHGRGERPIRPRHNQRPIAARFDGNPTVGPRIRRRWLPDLSETRSLRSSVNLDKTSIPIPRNHSAFPHRRALLGCDRFPATGASRKCDSAHFRS